MRQDEVKLAFRFHKGLKTLPTLVFLGGYKSDMMGTKAVFLDKFCAEEGLSYLRFDYSGQGESSGDFKDGCIGVWLNDALTIINHTIKGDMILIGSSMGGWIGLLLSQILGDRVTGFIGIAAAPDFTEYVWHNQMSKAHQTICLKNGFLETPEGDYFTMKLFEDGLDHLIFDKPLHLNCPIILLQGKKDDVVPYQMAQKLADHITSHTPPELIFINDGDHRLTREEDLDVLVKIISKFTQSAI